MDEQEFDELCRTAYIPLKPLEDPATSRSTATRAATRAKRMATGRRHLKRGQCPGNGLICTKRQFFVSLCAATKLKLILTVAQHGATQKTLFV
jgi:hypothetical protein